MHRFIVYALTVLVFSVTSAYAGSGHSHGPVIPVAQEQAIENAIGAVAAIIEKGKLDASWSEIKPMKAEKKKYQNGIEWVVTFSNPEVTEQEKKILYVFLSLDGQFLAANFSGD